MSSEEQIRDDLEQPSVRTGIVLLVGIGCAVFVLAAIGILQLIYRGQAANAPPLPVQSFPSPDIRAGGPGQLRELEGRQRQQLSNYRWANQDKSLVAIPIQRAMDLIVKRGAQAYDPIAAQPPTPPSAEATP